MTEEKEKNKQYQTEWSFSFEKMGDQINEFVQSLGIQGEQAIKQQVFAAPLDSAETADVRLDLSVGQHLVSTLPADSTDLIEADCTYVCEINFVVSGKEARTVQLNQDSSVADWFRSMFGWIGSGRKLKWDVKLSPNVLTNLVLRGGVGESKIDLSALKVSGLQISLGTGEMKAVLPARQQYAVQISGGIGQFEVTIPDETDADLKMSAGTGETIVRFGANCNATAQISGGIGECRLYMPKGAAIRVEARTGVGGVSIHGVPLQKVRGGEEFVRTQGVWETSDYETAEKRITVRFEGGVGELVIR
ncbi:MAG: hypothetical protein IPK19_03700 [Chloroflexi bacterium]|nr:hypothetical protein [Chloroflexota bacterium]